MSSLVVVILAAGHGSRMKSKKNKVLHEVGGIPMVELVLESSEAISDLQPIVVVSPHDHDVKDLIGSRAIYVEQSEQLGTGHATLMAGDVLKDRSDQVLVTYADMPLLRPSTLKELARKQRDNKASVSILTVEGESDSTFGRVLRNANGEVTEIVEVAETKLRANSEELLQTRELNAGVYCFESEWLWDNISSLPLRVARDGQEYYLTDMIGLAVSQGKQVEAIVVEDPDECLGAGTRKELAVVDRAFRQRINGYWMDQGITIVDPAVTYIDKNVTIGSDTILLPNSHLMGSTVVGESCRIGPNTVIRDAHIGDECTIEQAVVEAAMIDAHSVVEPFSYLRG